MLQAKLTTLHEAPKRINEAYQSRLHQARRAQLRMLNEQINLLSDREKDEHMTRPVRRRIQRSKAELQYELDQANAAMKTLSR